MVGLSVWEKKRERNTEGLRGWSICLRFFTPPAMQIAAAFTRRLEIGRQEARSFGHVSRYQPRATDREINTKVVA